MPDSKISQLPAIGTLPDTVEFVVANAGGNSKITGAVVKASIAAAALPFEQVFVIGDWTSEGAFHALNYASTVHNRGDAPMVSVYKLVSGTQYKEVGVDEIQVDEGALKILIPDSLTAFDGKLIIT